MPTQPIHTEMQNLAKNRIHLSKSLYRKNEDLLSTSSTKMETLHFVESNDQLEGASNIMEVLGTF